jgi:hypothetical protein
MTHMAKKGGNVRNYDAVTCLRKIHTKDTKKEKNFYHRGVVTEPFDKLRDLLSK